MASVAEGATAKERMAAKVGTAAGRALYARRKVIVEPVYGEIEGGRGFRRFSVRGLEKINGEWRLVCLTHDLLEIWRYGCVLRGNQELAKVAKGALWRMQWGTTD